MSLHKLLESSELISQGAEAVRTISQMCLECTPSTIVPIESLQSLLDLSTIAPCTPQISLSQEIQAPFALSAAHTGKDHL